jgi:hypothetical protein
VVAVSFAPTKTSKNSENFLGKRILHWDFL